MFTYLVMHVFKGHQVEKENKIKILRKAKQILLLHT